MVNRSARLLFFLRPLLWPLSLIYALITWLRNFMFDTGLLKSAEPPVFSIGIGNLSVGGTGKTPMVSFLIQKLDFENIAVLSRGYGRKTKGFREVNHSEDPSTVGDEIFMLFKRHQNQARFFVCESRVEGVERIMASYPQTDLILFDDVFQHRHVKPGYLLLLSTYQRPFFKDHLMLFGQLREARKGAGRADSIVFTKCPESFSKDNYQNAAGPNQAVYFSKVKVEVPRNSFAESLITGGKVNIVSALADNKAFVNQIETTFEIQQMKLLRDHYAFAKTDLVFDNSKLPVICSEKDWVKIEKLLKPEEKPRFYVQKIQVEIDNEADLLRNIMEAYKRFKEEKGSVING
ncbi:tetraacyldisaccharide 4'-kinase [Jiulongibacter sediminis]|uniref:tetraacyldisaccharide 4'-kinase n=1 Tax=Jiulongibacter sediminis TaxID=1605367 RepID=UPI0026EC8599|nr:tetraacyldisaccharide 4'-kinase [Jiulongibacter sediminis]